MYTPLTLFLLLLLILVLAFVQLFKLTKSSSEINLPPSPPKLTIIGNLHQLLETLPHRSLKALSDRYGPLMFVYFSQSPTLVVSSTEMMKTHDIAFFNRPRTTAGLILLYNCQDVGFVPYGEFWRQIRKICVSELVSLKRVHSFQHVREEEVSCLINKIRLSCFNRGSVNLSEMLLVVSNNIVSRCVLCRKVEKDTGKRKFGELTRTLLVQFTTLCFGDMFPFFGWLDVLTGFMGRLKATAKSLDALLDQVIEEHRILQSDGHDHDHDHNQSDRKDFLDILLQLQTVRFWG